MNGSKVFRAFGAEGAARFLSSEEYVRGTEKSVVLCDGEAERILASALEGTYPQAVNLRRAAALQLLWRCPPQIFAGRDVCCANGAAFRDELKFRAVFVGLDETCEEIFKALISTFALTRLRGGEVCGESVPCRFYLNGEEMERFEKMPYVGALNALREAEGKADYYEMPFAPAEISVADSLSGDDGEYRGVFVWAVVANGDRERAERTRDVLRKRGATCAVFYSSDRFSGEDGVYTFDCGEGAAEFFMFAQRLAVSRNEVYSGIKKDEGGVVPVLPNVTGAEKIKRESNLYAVVAIRQILLQLGFDCAEQGEDAKDMFDALYDCGNPRTRGADGAIRYDNEVCSRNSVRLDFAKREHIRWNGYVAACGVGPASRTEYSTVDKNALLAAGKHVNLTTWEGLAGFRREEAERKGTDEESTDVQRYDFQLADEAVRILEKNGLKTVRRKEC